MPMEKPSARPNRHSPDGGMSSVIRCAVRTAQRGGRRPSRVLRPLSGITSVCCRHGLSVAAAHRAAIPSRRESAPSEWGVA
jgi:hypothetical protein